MAVNIKIVIPSLKNKDDFSKTSSYSCLVDILKTTPDDVSVVVKPYLENTKGLSDIYQDELNKKDADYMIFMHDDVEIHDHFFLNKLLKAHEQYDIVGLAGSIYQNYNTENHMAWHLCMDHASNARGIVNHCIPKGFNKPYINSVYFGPTPSSVVVIDGLFMSFKTSSLQEKPELFDRQFTFHHYDMAMCCNAHAENLKVGVWPIFVIHHGLGEFINDKIWQKHAVEFKQKYGKKVLFSA